MYDSLSTSTDTAADPDRETFILIRSCSDLCRIARVSMAIVGIRIRTNGLAPYAYFSTWMWASCVSINLCTVFPLPLTGWTLRELKLLTDLLAPFFFLPFYFFIFFIFIFSNGVTYATYSSIMLNVVSRKHACWFVSLCRFIPQVWS